jgi:O-antigen/teichoic acid export membrane protein
MAAEFFLGISFVNSLWYKLRDKTRYGAYIAVIGSVISLILNILLIPIIGYMGSAIAVFVCFLSTMILTYYWGQKFLPVPYDLKRIGFYSLITLIFFLLSVFMSDKGSLLKYSTNTLLLVLFFLLVFYKEKSELLSIIRIRFRKKRN